VWYVDWCRKLLEVAIQNYTEYKETTVASLMRVLVVEVPLLSTELSTSTVMAR
jgi:hypothetical protein